MADVPLIDLASQRRRLGGRVEAAIARVLEHGSFILGPEVAELEERLAAYVGIGHAVTCSSGTDALLMAFMAHGVGPGDAVVVPSFTFAATAEAAVLAGAVPVFADVLPDTFDLDPKSVELAVDAATSSGLRAAAVVTVDLYGQPADYDAIGAVCEARDLLLVADAAQSFGGAWRGQRVGGVAEITTTSFFPSKPLGCYGDGGAIFTDDGDVAERLRSVRVHGRGTSKYDNARLGLNARLDTLQAAILLEKLQVIDEERDARARVAAAYNERLPSTISVPAVRVEATSAWAYYTVRVDHRDETAAALAAEGVSTAIYYPTPLHRQPAYAEYPRATEDLGVCDALAATVLSLPMHAYLDEASQNRVIEAVTDAVAGRSWLTGDTRGSGG